MTNVVVIGAGITGLAAALDLVDDFNVVVLEADDRVGGKIMTTEFAGLPVDCAADAFLARVPEGRQMCERLGLVTQLVSPATSSAFVWVDEHLRRLPEGLVLGVPTDTEKLRAANIVSELALSAIEEDLDRTQWCDRVNGPDPLGADDISVGELIRGRLNDEIHEKLVSPLLSGVNAGNADQLSLAAGAAQLAAAARQHPSLIKALLAQKEKAVANDGPVFYGLPTGTETLITAMATAVLSAGGSVQTNTKARSLRKTTDGWNIQCEQFGEEITIATDFIVLATPSFATAELLAPYVPSVATQIGDIAYASVAMITLAIEKRHIDHPLDGSGFLVSTTSALPTLTACSWASSKWSHLKCHSQNDELAILRVSAGKFGDEHALALSDEDLLGALAVDLERTIGLHGPFAETRITRWRNGLPQFTPGHLGRVHHWRETLSAELPSLFLAGAAYDGLGLPACLRQGANVAFALRETAR